MKRRELLGLGALLGLAPLLPKLDVRLMDDSVESFTPLIPPTPTASIQETVDSLFTIHVDGSVIITQKDGEVEMTGTGYIDDNHGLIYWKTIIKENCGYGNEPIIEINHGTFSGKMVSIHQEAVPMPEFYIEGVKEPFCPHPNFINTDPKVSIICRKI